MVFGFPLMFLAPYAAESDLAALITCIVVLVAFVALNIVLFRRSIFRKKAASAGVAGGNLRADGNAVTPNGSEENAGGCENAAIDSSDKKE